MQSAKSDRSVIIPSSLGRHAYKLAISMLSQHIRIDAAGRDLCLVRQRAAQARRVKTRACAQDLRFRQS